MSTEHKDVHNKAVVKHKFCDVEAVTFKNDFFLKIFA